MLATSSRWRLDSPESEPIAHFDKGHLLPVRSCYRRSGGADGNPISAFLDLPKAIEGNMIRQSG
jgi:hypothetical protein